MYDTSLFTIYTHFPACNIFFIPIFEHWETSYVWNTDDHFARVSILFGFRPCQIFCLPLEIFLGWCSDEMTLMMGIRNEMQLSFYPDTLYMLENKNALNKHFEQKQDFSIMKISFFLSSFTSLCIFSIVLKFYNFNCEVKSLVG